MIYFILLNLISSRILTNNNLNPANLAFYVKETIPEDSSIIPNNQIIEVLFNKSIDPSTVNLNFIVTSLTQNPVPGEKQLIDQNKKIIFTPDEPFKNGDTVIVLISNGLRSIDQEPLDSGYVFTYFVEDTQECELYIYEFNIIPHPVYVNEEFEISGNVYYTSPQCSPDKVFADIAGDTIVSIPENEDDTLSSFSFIYRFNAPGTYPVTLWAVSKNNITSEPISESIYCEKGTYQWVKATVGSSKYLIGDTIRLNVKVLDDILDIAITKINIKFRQNDDIKDSLTVTPDEPLREINILYLPKGIAPGNLEILLVVYNTEDERENLRLFVNILPTKGIIDTKNTYIYPNPYTPTPTQNNQEEIFSRVLLNEEASVEIKFFTEDGTLVYSIKKDNLSGDNIIPIDISSLKSGMYYVQIIAKAKDGIYETILKREVIIK